MNKAKQRKKSYNAALKVLMDKYNRNLITLEEYKTQISFAKGRYGIRQNNKTNN